MASHTGNWFTAMTGGQEWSQSQDNKKLQILNNAEDRRRRIALENETNAYNRKVNADKLVQMNQLASERDRVLGEEETRRIAASNATLSSQSPFGPGAVSGQVTGQATGTAAGAQQPYSAIPEYDMTAQVDANTAYDTAHAARVKKQATDAAAFEALKAKEKGQWDTGITNIQGVVKGKTYEDYLPTFEGVASEKSLDYARSGFEQHAVDTPQVQKAQSFVSGVESFLEQGKGSASGTGSNWANIAINYFGLTAGSSADQKRVLQENRDMEDFFNTNVIGSSDAEKWFAMYPDEMEEVFGGATDSKTQRENLFAYYQTVIKPALAAKGEGKPVHTKGAIAQAKSDYMSLITNTDNAIEALKQFKVGADKEIKDQVAAYEATLKKAAQAKIDGDEAREQELLDQIQYNPVHRRFDKAAFGKEVQRIADARAERVKMFQLATRTQNLENTNLYRAEVEKLDAELWAEMNAQGITDMITGKGPEILEGTMSEFLGSSIRLQPRSDGKWHVISNGQLLDNTESKVSGTTWTLTDLTKMTRYRADKNYKSAQDEHAALIANTKAKGVVTQSDVFKATQEANIKRIEKMGELNKEQLKRMGVKFSGTSGDGSTLISVNGKLYEHNPNRVPITVGDVETTPPALKEIYAPQGLDIFSMLNPGVPFDKALFNKELMAP